VEPFLALDRSLRRDQQLDQPRDEAGRVVIDAPAGRRPEALASNSQTIGGGVFGI